MPPATVCDRARQTKDARFDGLFFTGVRTTKIYCRPVCPAPTPKRENIVYFPTAGAAASAGYRPCLRCRPELSPDLKPDDLTVRRSLALITEGWLQERSVETLAAEVGISARHLRRLFIEKTGATPQQVHQTRRLLLAKQLLTETTLPVTEVAMAAGFASIRRFNSAFKAACAVAPSAVRRQPRVLTSEAMCLHLAFRPPLDFAHALDALRGQAIRGIEQVTATAYERVVDSAPLSWIRVGADPRRPELHLHAFGIVPEGIQPLVRRVRRMFDLDADLHSAHDVLQNDPALALSVSRRPGLRLIGAWDGFEAAVQEVVEQQVETRNGMSPIARLVQFCGERVDGAPHGLNYRFPSAERLATERLEEAIGLQSRIGQMVRRLAIAVGNGAILFHSGQSPDDFAGRLASLTGLSMASAQRVAMRALGDPDAFPFATSDASAEQVGSHLGERSRSWRPWRAYAALHLGLLAP